MKISTKYLILMLFGVIGILASLIVNEITQMVCGAITFNIGFTGWYVNKYDEINEEVDDD